MKAGFSPSKFFVTTVFLLVIWLLISGVWESSRWDEWGVGIAMSAMIAAFTSNLLIKSPVTQVLDVRRWLRGIAYLFYYYFYAEVKSHIDVICRILHPAMPINPGIVSVPYQAETDFGLTCVSCSITNTPGTVTIEVDKDRKRFFVHWIDVKSPDESVCYREVAEGFDKRLKEIFG